MKLIKCTERIYRKTREMNTSGGVLFSKEEVDEIFKVECEVGSLYQAKVLMESSNFWVLISFDESIPDLILPTSIIESCFQVLQDNYSRGM